ncbi:DUF998 domain-containing protein [Actinoplanes sp. NBRC 103695]|uniref:DUF998 domain-containing protein n=1 Tax=Actinoplanes sp. NBRC 103695 TaxID=3032202 RepID=UPI0024A3AFD7|nr:DUF998 domain-containing protein [Actinoplanes sp. NBRC 103695]GLY94085.1 hypothetical protein Acsp02_13410 [Actinoplanes sp. NBRC 103695]
MTTVHAQSESQVDLATSPGRRRLAFWATAIGLGGVRVSALIIALMHVVGPTAAISPVDLTISEYALASSGWAFGLGILILAGASFSLFAAAVISRRMPLLSPASVFATLWSAGLIVLVLVPKAPYAAPEGIGGDVHRYASFVAFVSLPIAVLLVARSTADRRPWAQWLGIASLAWFVPMVVAMAYQGFTGGAAWWTVIPLGLIERGMAGTEIAAILVLAWPSARRTRSAPGHRGRSSDAGIGENELHDRAGSPATRAVAAQTPN